jgi:HSP20 family molecular chaperone IbpA
MQCPRCRKDVEKRWDFCPHCGSMLTMNQIDTIMTKMAQQMKQMNKTSKKDLEVFDLSPYFKKGTGAGFSIKIMQTNHNKPNVSIRTFGDINKERLEKQIYKQFGTKKSVAETRRENSGFLHKLGISKSGRPEGKSGMKSRVGPLPKQTEEPKTVVKRLESKVIVNMEIPGVRSENNIDIKELENSLEVRALAGDKAYFKILTKPEQFKLVSKKFNRGRLHLEFS